MFKRISVIGGDLRQLTAARLFEADGYEVALYGFEQSVDVVCEQDIHKALDADAVILPLPVSFDGEFLNAPFGSRKYGIKEITEGLNPAAVVFGGQMKPEFIQELECRRIKYCDYLNREELAIKNAVPTAFTIWIWICCSAINLLFILDCRELAGLRSNFFLLRFYASFQLFYILRRR